MVNIGSGNLDFNREFNLEYGVCHHGIHRNTNMLYIIFFLLSFLWLVGS